MANLSGAYDPSAEAAKDFSPVPTGEYYAAIIDSDMKPTKANDGHYLELCFEIKDGPCAGRRVWSRLNLDNRNAKAVEIANREFAAIRAAAGVPNPRDSVELHGRPMLIRVEYVKADGIKQKNDGNEIRAYKKLEGAVPTPSTAAQPAATGSAPPWASRAA